MKTIGGIGDIHGRDIWKEIVKDKDVDLWVFIGDYWDSKYISFADQKTNFLEILDYKRVNPNKVVLLFGNHDLHYLNIGAEYSGYQRFFAYEIGILLKEAIREGLFEVAYKHEQFLFTHAGLTKTWCDIVLDVANPVIDSVAVKLLNSYLVYQPSVFGFNRGQNNSNYGDDVTQGPMWVRENSLIKDMVDDVICVVGHTQIEYLSIDLDNRLIMIDCLYPNGEYLVIENNIPKSRQIIL